MLFRFDFNTVANASDGGVAHTPVVAASLKLATDTTDTTKYSDVTILLQDQEYAAVLEFSSPLRLTDATTISSLIGVDWTINTLTLELVHRYQLTDAPTLAGTDVRLYSTAGGFASATILASIADSSVPAAFTTKTIALWAQNVAGAPAATSGMLLSLLRGTPVIGIKPAIQAPVGTSYQIDRARLYIDATPPDLIYNARKIGGWQRGLSTKRCEVLSLGDSNFGQGSGDGATSSGWQKGISHRLTALHPTWGSALTNTEGLSPYAWNNYEQTNQDQITSSGGDPAFITDKISAGGGDLTGMHFATPYPYLNDAGSGTASGSNSGITLKTSHPIAPATTGLRYRLWYAKFLDGAGEFKLQGRNEGNPGYNTFDGAVVTTAPLADQFDETTYVDWSPTTTNYNNTTFGGWYRAGAGSVVPQGPFAVQYQRVERPTATAGVACSTFFVRGGHPMGSFHGAALAMQTWTDAHQDMFYKVLRTFGASRFLIYANFGFNDRDDGIGTSLGPAAVADGDSAAAIVDNAEAVYREWWNMWLRNGGNPKRELFFLFQVAHTFNSPEQAELDSYRAPMLALSDRLANLAVVQPHRVFDYREAIEEGYYVAPGSEHLLPNAGSYATAGARVADAILAAVPSAMDESWRGRNYRRLSAR